MNYKKMTMINNKKGAEGPSAMGMVLSFILAVIVVGVILYFVFDFMGILGGGLALIDDQVALKVTACNNALNLRNFCNYDEVGKKGKFPLYINCQYQGANFQNSLIENNTFQCDNPKTFTDACSLFQADSGFKGAVLNKVECKTAEDLAAATEKAARIKAEKAADAGNYSGDRG